MGMDVSYASDQVQNNSKKTTNGNEMLQPASVTFTAESSNDSSYKDQLMSALDLYRDDLNYSSEILDEYVKKNISNREAFVSTVSIFALVSQNVEEVTRLQPPEKYKDHHDRSLQALLNLKWYIWSLAKFYETNNVIYASKAREYFNTSLKYYNGGVIGF